MELKNIEQKHVIEIEEEFLKFAIILYMKGDLNKKNSKDKFKEEILQSILEISQRIEKGNVKDLLFLQ